MKLNFSPQFSPPLEPNGRGGSNAWSRGGGAGGECAADVASLQLAQQPWWNLSSGASHADRLSVGAVNHDVPARIASESPGSLGSDRVSVFEFGHAVQAGE